jgi:coproporphyrinogen III oxidase
MMLDEKKTLAADWFRTLRDDICARFEAIEAEYATHMAHQTQGVRSASEPHAAGVVSAANEGGASPPLSKATFTKTPWQRPDGGAGEMSLMKGRVFEKVGVNISTVHGEFSEQFRKEIPGAEQNPRFWASGISLVAHMASPLVPAAHFNTRMLVVGEGSRQQSNEGRVAEGEPRSGGGLGAMPPSGAAALHNNKFASRIWFGGGGDLNPMFENDSDTADFHAAFKTACDELDAITNASRTSAAMSPRSGAKPSEYYAAFKQWCDEYFFIPHRGVARGVGGIFYDYLGLNRFGADTSPVTSGRFGKGGVTAEATFAGMQRAANAPIDWTQGFAFTQSVGRAFASIYPELIRRHMFESWTAEQRHHQLVTRGRYAEYNLLYDRGTRFGLMTGGNAEAILMSLPPVAVWE